jgi:hypothetical protein
VYDGICEKKKEAAALVIAVTPDSEFIPHFGRTNNIILII